MTRHTALLEGPTGTGKTTSLRTIPPGRRLFYLATEPGMDIVFKKKVLGIPEMDYSRLHYKYLPPARLSFETLRAGAQKINSLTIEQLQSQKTGISKSEYDQFLQLYDACAHFRCDCHGNDFGPVDELPEDDIFAIDGLTGISTMSMDLVVGAKPVKTQPDWGVAMDNLERFVAKCVFDIKCSFILLAHIGREKDEVRGGTLITTQTLGVKLAPKLIPMFDEVLLSMKTGEGIRWSNDEPDADLKCRYLPMSNKLKPDWAQLFAEGT